MIKFIKPDDDLVNYRGCIVKNTAINLALVIKIGKSTIKYYPDNEGKPSIIFYFNENEYESWIFNNLKDRDKKFDEILEAHK